DLRPLTPDDWQIVLMDATEKRQRVRALPAAVCIEPGLSLREYTVADYLTNLNRHVEFIRWPKQLQPRPVEFVNASMLIGSNSDSSRGSFVDPHEPSKPMEPLQAADQFLEELGLSGKDHNSDLFQGPIEDVPNPPEQKESERRVTGFIAADEAGRLDRTAKSVVSAVGLLAASSGTEPLIVLLSFPVEDLQRSALA